MRDKFLYVIAAYPAGPVKLGLSGDPPRRLRQLQTGQAERLVLHHCEAVEAARGSLLERLLHRDVRHQRQLGEWFAMSVAEAISYVQFTIIQYALVDDLKGAFAPAERKGWIVTEPNIGATVRLYNDPLNECFDEGQVIAVKDGVITVEFCDWQQTWPADDFRYGLQSARPYFEPLSIGTIVQRFPVGERRSE